METWNTGWSSRPETNKQKILSNSESFLFLSLYGSMMTSVSSSINEDTFVNKFAIGFTFKHNLLYLKMMAVFCFLFSRWNNSIFMSVLSLQELLI